MRRSPYLVLALVIFTAFTLNAVPSKTGKKDPLRALYEDPVRFHQLSAGAQMLLHRKFGVNERTQSMVALPAPEQTATDLSNVLVNDPAQDDDEQDTQSTAAIVLGSGTNVIAAFTDSGSFTGLNNHFTGFSSSANSGTSFSDHGTLINSTEGDSGSPVLASNTATGTIFLSTLGFATAEMIPVFRSVNDGSSFTAPVNATPGYVASGDFLDKPWISVDNFTGGAGTGNVYVVWRHFPFSGSGSVRLTRSTDGGSTWGPNLGISVINGTVQGPNVSIGPDHSVYVLWYDQTSSPRSIRIKRSTDQGDTFSTATTVVSLLGTGNNGDLGLNGGFATNSYPQAAVNPANGHVYAVYNDDPAGVDRANIFLRRSTDSGATWNVIQVNNDSTNNDQFFPSIAVTPDGTRLIVSWYDRRNDPANSDIQRFAEIFDIDGSGNLISLTEFPVSTSEFPPVVGQDPEVTPTFMGEYDQIAADNTNFYLAWSDNRFGNTFHSNQPDIMFSKIPVNGPGAILDFVSSSVNDAGGNNNGAVDQNECFLLNITIQNNGSSTATGMTATLATTTPNITISQSESSFADIAPGANGTTESPFQIQTSPSFACGQTDIDFQLTVNTAADGSFQIPFVVSSGSNGPAVQFDIAGSVVIPDFGTVDVPMIVSGITAPVAKVTTNLQINHTNDSDLDLYLIGPDAAQVELSTDNGGTSDNYGTSCASNSNKTTFDDAAAVSISSPSAVPPFTGSFKPEGELLSFRAKSGTAVNGTWLLRITDDTPIDSGTLNCASVFVSPVICTPAGGACGCPPISITPATLPDGAPGVAYSQQISASGGVGPYTFSLDSGTLPAGITLSSSGLLSGTTTDPGTFNFTVLVADNGGCEGTKNYSLNILCPTIQIAPATLPDGTINVDYDETITASGGTAPYTFTLDSGSLPAGLDLAADGSLTGIPTTESQSNFTIRATDVFGCSATLDYSLTVNCAAITLAPPVLPNGSVGVPYLASISASGGTAPYTFAVTSGNLPDGITLAGDGSLSGTPTLPGIFNFTVTATDDSGCSGSQDYSINTSCLFCDDFEDGVLAGDWNYIKQGWNETGGELIGDPEKKKAIAVASPAFGGCTNCTIDVTMMSEGGAGNRLWVLAWYLDKRNTVELLMEEENDKWVLKQRSGGSIVRKVNVVRTIDPNVNYTVRLAYDGSNFTLFVDGVDVLTMQPAAVVPNGTAGFQVKQTVGHFGEIIIN
jgi:hypothetical protein